MFVIWSIARKTALYLLALCLLPAFGACSLLQVGGESETGIGGKISAMAPNPAVPAGFERGSAMKTGNPGQILHQGQAVPSQNMLAHDSGLLLPDGRGGLVLIPGVGAQIANPNYVDARELKLKMRELAAQLVVGLDGSFSSYIALPIAFVTQDDFDRSSSLGRFIVEQMYYEFNQRGLPTRDYRLDGKLTQREDGEFILVRKAGAINLDPRTLYLVGTYYTDNFSVFINARLIRSDGRVVRAGQLVMASTPLTRRMIATSGKRLSSEGLEIRDFNLEARPPEASSVYDY
jgi:hypothetical protein